MLDYTRGIFAFLQSEFLNSLYTSNVCIVCGYGFGDQGINTRLSEWLDAKPNRRMIVVSPSGDKFRAEGFARWEHNGQLSLIEKPISEVGWSEIQRIILSF